MAEMPVRLGPSFGGITRIRFKGFDRRLSPIISARRLPRTYFVFRIRRVRAKSMMTTTPLNLVRRFTETPYNRRSPAAAKRRRHACLYKPNKTADRHGERPTNEM